MATAHSATVNSSAAQSSHLSALHDKHAGLEARLHDEMTRPAPDAAAVQALKRQKLKLKEEIQRG